MGSQVLDAGDGFYIPGDHAYGYRAGPEGAEVLEFRHATSFDIKLDEKAEVSTGFSRPSRRIVISGLPTHCHRAAARRTVPTPIL